MAYKIRNFDGDQCFGVVAHSLESLRSKACQKLNLKSQANLVRIVLFEDGTEVTDNSYLKTLPPQTVFVALETNKKWLPSKTDLKDVLSAFENSKKQLMDFATKAKCNSYLQELLMNLSSCSDRAKTIAECKKEDPEWFLAVPSKFVKKEDVLRSSAERRVRGYFRQVQELVNSKSKASNSLKKELKFVLQQFKSKLSENKYYGNYFVRSAAESERLCDEEGWFQCEGLYSELKCSQKHIINPYASHDMRILFSTWNLDHQIEKKRQIIPSMRKAILNMNSHQALNWQYFYSLLFTRDNLKLVNIICHDKRVHDETCDPSRFYC